MSTGVVQQRDTAERKNRLLVPILLVVIVVLAVAFGVFYVLNGRQSLQLPQSGSTVVVNGNYEVYGPEEYTVNLADSGQRRYLKVSVALAYANKRLAKELGKRQAQIRDLMITTLRSQCADDLSGSEGLEALREEIKTAINGILDTGRIYEVYFTSFLVQ